LETPNDIDVLFENATVKAHLDEYKPRSGRGYRAIKRRAMRSGSRKTTRDPSNRRQAKARGTSAPLGLPWVPSARPLATAVEYALSSPVESAALLYASPLPPPPQRLVPRGPGRVAWWIDAVPVPPCLPAGLWCVAWHVLLARTSRFAVESCEGTPDAR
jgi:hypothetical protein